ncbi:MAG: electron transport complex subunit RsxE [Gemmatimonadales bacterium]|nr:electron transport complex subunit RsxE [Gemmatimonadales bacterium]NIN12074.1 electron transport complex subunit RsxE [Gemmatimonadales bacterium]NIR03309.1 electron transport complex subunit RsxE [Gemmatimonadales bacterium]NIS66989.1 electron transport complex subunit RsxE [Gemmatimonadales bacterium]
MKRQESAEEVVRGSHCGHAGASAIRIRRTTPGHDLLRGLWRENPVFRQLLGLCPALAVTNTVANSLAMGTATFSVLVGSSLLVSSFKRVIPEAIRLSTYILIIATWVTIADMVMEATVPQVHKALGAFVYLIVVNCMILSRQEAFASRRPVGRSLLDAIGTGSGFILALFLMGAVREVIGYGSFLGHGLFGASYQPWTVMILPPGGFLAIGFLLLAFGWIGLRREARRKAREWSRLAVVKRAA